VKGFNLIFTCKEAKLELLYHFPFAFISHLVTKYMIYSAKNTILQNKISIIKQLE